MINGQRYKLAIHRRNNKKWSRFIHGQDLYNLALNLTLTEEIQNQLVYLYTARGNTGTSTAT